MGQSIRRCTAKELRFGGYDLICTTDASMDLHLRLLAEVASDAIYYAACCQIVTDKNRSEIAKLKSSQEQR